MSSKVLIGPALRPRGIDKRRAKAGDGDLYTRMVGSRTIFTANATGTTTTIVGANAAPGTNDANVVRRGDRFKLYTAAGVIKEETVFEITGVAVGASTTVTYAPASAVAPVSTDIAKLVGSYDFEDPEALDSALTAFNSTVYSADRLAQMTLNDKYFAYRQNIDPAGL